MKSVIAKLCVLLLGLCMPLASNGADKPAPARTFRILHVMSFDSPWRWTDGQLAGFKDGLGRDVHAEYRVVQMDIKHNSTPEAKEKKAAEAQAIIEEWKPDLVYTSDDDAQQYVTRKYLNRPLPFVFSGVNKEPREHGFDTANNVTGVLEREHFVESMRLLQAISPKVKRVAVLTDGSTQMLPVIERIRAGIAELPGVSLVAVDSVPTFDEYKAKILAYPQHADAVVQLGVFNLKGTNGQNVSDKEVMRWMAENNSLPEISFWIDRIFYGVLCAVTVSEREQGLAAGRLARRILVDGVKPNSLPMLPTVKGNPSINLARAKALGLSIKSSLLLSTEVVTGYDWDKPAK